MPIDLSLVPARELPVREETILVAGKEIPVSYKPIVGEDRLRVWSSTHNNDAPHDVALLERIHITLEKGVGMNEKEIEKLISLDWEAALSLAGKVISFSTEFQNAAKAEEDKAGKNSDPEGSEVTVP